MKPLFINNIPDEDIFISLMQTSDNSTRVSTLTFNVITQHGRQHDLVTEIMMYRYGNKINRTMKNVDTMEHPTQRNEFTSLANIKASLPIEEVFLLTLEGGMQRIIEAWIHNQQLNISFDWTLLDIYS